MRLGGKKVLVTGGTGFLGGYVLRELDAAGAATVGVGRLSYDLLDVDATNAMLDDHRPDAVVHLAATVGGIGANQREPGRFVYENALMGLQLLEACRLHGTEKVLVVGTVCSYPGTAPVPLQEDDLWAGYPEETNAPYGLAKRLLLVQAQAYRQQYGMNAIFLLPANLYGPGDNVDLDTGHVIPSMIRRFSEARQTGDRTVALWGDGSPTREFLYVADAARACRLALEAYDGGEPVNVGTGREISISELAGVVADAVGYTGSISWDTGRPNGQLRRRLEISRAREFFGFEATMAFEAGVAETVRWFERQGGSLAGPVPLG